MLIGGLKNQMKQKKKVKPILLPACSNGMGCAYISWITKIKKHR